MISRIIKVEVGVISQSQRLRLITPTKALIILDITKTETNIVLLYIERNNKIMFLLLHRRQATQSVRT